MNGNAAPVSDDPNHLVINLPASRLRNNRSPKALGVALILSAACMVVVPLLSLALMYLMPSATAISCQEQTESSSTPMYDSNSIACWAHRFASFVVDVFPRLTAASFTGYLGICCGYVALAYLGIVQR